MEQDLGFDWDEANIGHIGQHGVNPGEVEEVFSHEATDLRYEVVNGEERWTSIGHPGQLRILVVVVWTMRGESIRAVTAFGAGKAMVSEYFRREDGENMAATDERMKIPEFASEEEEARWWDEHKAMVEANLLTAMRDGTAQRGSAQRLVREARGSKNITIRMPLADPERARQLSARKGLAYQTFIKMLLHEALDTEEKRLIA